MLPLEGVRVVDLTRFLAGPFCTMELGDYGADVIKIEPLDGDHTRTQTLRPDLVGNSYFFAAANRSKRSVTIDFTTAEGKEIIRRLARTADVVIENFRPGVMDRLGLSARSLRDANPRLIYCGVTGFGQTGPYAGRPGFDQVGQGMSGFMSITGQEPTGPTRAGIALADLTCATTACRGVLYALLARARTGRGQEVYVSIVDSMVALLTWSAGMYFETGVSPGVAGNNHPLSSPFGVYRAKDKPFNLCSGHEVMWRRLCEALDRPELADDLSVQNGARSRGEPGGVEPHPDRGVSVPDRVGVDHLPERTRRRLRADLQPRGGLRGPSDPAPADARRDAASGARAR